MSKTYDIQVSNFKAFDMAASAELTNEEVLARHWASFMEDKVKKEEKKMIKWQWKENEGRK